MSNTTRRHFLAAVGTLAVAAAMPLAAQTVDALKAKGEITIGMLVDFPPYGILNAQNQPDGYDADVARLLGEHLGVKIKLVAVTGPNRIPFLLTNKVDLLVASLAISPERAKQVLFSEPYATAGVVLYGLRSTGVKTPEDMKRIRIGVARASTQDMALTAKAPAGTELRRFDDDATAMQALLSGQVDAIGCSTSVAAQIDKRAPADTFTTLLPITQQYMAIAMRPGQDDLKASVDAFVAKAKADGRLNGLYRKWLGTDLPELKTPT